MLVNKKIVISKELRLHEREVKKVLQKWKPFFSYGIVLNSIKNKVWFARFAIVIWWKSVDCNVSRTFFRRRFYDFIQEKLKTEELNASTDYVFVVKKQTKLNRKNQEALLSFQKDLGFLVKKTQK